MEGRLTYVEKSLEDQRNESRELRESLRHLDQKVDGLGATLSSRITALDQKVDAFGGALSSRIDALDQKVDQFREELSGKVDGVRIELASQVAALDAKMTSQFKWLVGINVTMWALTVTMTVTVILVGLEEIALR